MGKQSSKGCLGGQTWLTIEGMRVLLLVHPHFRPDVPKPKSLSERDVWQGLCKMGVPVEIAPVEGDWTQLVERVRRFRPTIAFNLLEEFRGEGVYDFHVVSWLEAMGIPYTGCNPRGLVVSRNKFWVYGIAAQLEILTPPTKVLASLPKSSARRFPIPQFVKFNREHASLGIRRDNKVRNADQLRRVVMRMRKLSSAELLVQDFISGYEVSVSVWGNDRPQALPPWQLHLQDHDGISTERIKFSAATRHEQRIRATRMRRHSIPELQTQSQRLYRALNLSGYARFDYRISLEGKAYLIDVNANPNLDATEDFAMSARAEGVEYQKVLMHLLDLGMQYQPAR